MILRSVDGIIRMLDADYIENDDIQKRVLGVCIDSRKVVEGNLYIPIKGVNNNGHTFVRQAIENGAVATLWNKEEANPPSDITVILVEDTTAALQQLAYVYRNQLSMKVIGITGSNGKTSTKDILAAMLSQRYITQKTLGNYNNEIGVPLTLLSMSENTQIAVVEMGMENLGELDFLTRMVQPDIAIITNIGTAHLENLGSMENIAKAKLEITHGLKRNGLFIYYGDQELLQNAVTMEELPGHIRIKTFGELEQNDYQLSFVSQSEEGISFSVNQESTQFHLDMLGKHQAINAMAALLAARELNLSNLDIQFGLQSIEKTGMRNELLHFDRALLLNDAYKSNPQSSIAALETLAMFTTPYKIAVLADMLDLGEKSDMIHFQLGKSCASYDIQEILTYGEMGAYITQGALQECDSSVHIQHFEDKKKLIAYLLPYHQKNCIILVKGSRGLAMNEVVDALIEETK